MAESDKAAKASSITGWIATAGACRSLRWPSNHAQNSLKSFQFGITATIFGFILVFSAENTIGVGTSTRGFTKTIHISGKYGTFVKTSPIPCIRCGELETHTGTSAPKDATSLSIELPSCIATRSIAAASADPPPMPAAFGNCFSKSMSAVKPHAAAAFQTRLLLSVGTPSEYIPLTLSDIFFAGVTINLSPTSAKTTRESNR